MALVLHNTLTRAKAPFVPEDPARVRLYVCGPTVYDFAHIGNARPVVVFDVLFRLLRRLYGAGAVTYVRNITDVDDKIIERHRQSGEPIAEITQRTAAAYQEDMAALGALAPTEQPRATHHIGEMIAMIGELVAAGHAYAADGHVLFHVPSLADYGRLSGHSRDELIAGARVEVAPYKRDPADFVLWKPSAADEPGWESPWGTGRPGWHIECSAMSRVFLGRRFDIHGGGIDLVFPHHENEIAQSCGAHDGALMAGVWMHNGYVQVDGEKMSKSLGNFITVRDLLDEFPGWGEAIRLALLAAHYRQPLDFTRDGLRAAKARLDRWYRVLLAAREAGALGPRDTADPEDSGTALDGAVLAGLEDDLNLPRALAALDAQAGRLAERPDDRDVAAAFLAAGRLIGVLAQDPETWFQGAVDTDVAAAIEARIAERQAARKARDFAEADRIRAALAADGIVLEDGPGGTTWRQA